MIMMMKLRIKDLNFEVLCRSVYALIGPGNVTLPTNLDKLSDNHSF